MAIKSYAQLIAAAQQIMSETVKKANDKIRFGNILTDLIDSKEGVFTRLAEVPETLEQGKFALVGTTLYVGDADNLPVALSGGGGGGSDEVQALIDSRNIVDLLKYTSARNTHLIVDYTPAEGLGIPDGASSIFTKTIPLGITTSRGLISSNESDTYSESGLSQLQYMYVEGQYQNALRVNNGSNELDTVSTPTASNLFQSQQFNAIFGNYAQTVSLVNCFIGRYAQSNLRCWFHNNTNVNAYAVILSMHIDQNALVIRYQKFGPTTGLSFPSGRKFVYWPL